MTAIAAKFNKPDFVPPPEKPIKPKPKVAPPQGEQTAAAKKMFEQKIKEQKPPSKTEHLTVRLYRCRSTLLTDTHQARFERKIEAQARSVQAMQEKKPLPQK